MVICCLQMLNADSPQQMSCIDFHDMHPWNA